jgi:hypothetical protein
MRPLPRKVQRTERSADLTHAGVRWSVRPRNPPGGPGLHNDRNHGPSAPPGRNYSEKYISHPAVCPRIGERNVLIF